MDYFFEGHWRMDWGFGNPNKTAALIAMLMVGSWIFAYLWRKGFWLSLLTSTILGAGLICTYSRGGLVATGCGLLALIAFTPRPWPRHQVVSLLIAIVGLAIFSYQSEAVQRYVKGVSAPDVSIENRLEIWSKVPRMMVDAPSGWGLGNSGNAYVQWYQPLDRTEKYRTLVSSHLTWLVEFGGLGRMLYLIGWSLVFLICWPIKSGGKVAGSGMALGIWITFAVAAFFSSTAESLWMWLFPILFLKWMFFLRIRHSSWPTMKNTCLVALSGPAIYGLLLLIGNSNPSPMVICGTRENVELSRAQIQDGSPVRFWVLAPDSSVLGDHYGHEIRRWISEGGSHPEIKPTSIRVSSKAEPHIADSQSILILSGNFPEDKGLGLNSLIVINPKVGPKRLDEMVQNKSVAIQVVWGEFFQNASRTEWQNWAQTHQQRAFSEVIGAGEFIHQWARYCDEPKHGHDSRSPSTPKSD